MNKLSKFVFLLVAVAVSFPMLALAVAPYDWKAPVNTAPTCNPATDGLGCYTPINVGSTQTKFGGLNLLGSVGVGTSTVPSMLFVTAPKGVTTTPLFIVASTTANSYLSRLFITNSGLVGINTSAPDAYLHVNGNLHLVGAFQDSANSGGVKGYVLQSTGSATKWVATSTLGLGGPTGTNYWTLSGTNLYPTNLSNNVGIGTVTPGGKLVVQGSDLTSFTSSSLSPITVQGGTYAANNVIGLDFKSANSTYKTMARVGAKVTGFGSYLQFGTSNSYANGITNTALTIDPVGNVGIGTVAPANKLEVVGKTKTTSLQVGASSVVDQVLTAVDTAGNAIWKTPASSSGSNYWTLTGTNLYNNNSGNVGIGTNAPTAKLDVRGTFKLADGTQGANKVLTSDVNGSATWQAPGASASPFAGCKHYQCTGTATDYLGDPKYSGSKTTRCWDNDAAQAGGANLTGFGFTYDKYEDVTDHYSTAGTSCPTGTRLISATAYCKSDTKTNSMYSHGGGITSMQNNLAVSVCDYIGYLSMGVIVTCCPTN